jgi:hypothetical protein
VADWPLLADNQFARAAGEDAAASTGTSITCGVANTKGAWVGLEAATEQDVSWALVRLVDPSAGTHDYLVDIGVGAAAAEQVVIPNVPLCFRSGGAEPHGFLVPVSIPAGSRVAARGQSSGVSPTLKVAVMLFGGGFKQSSALGLVSAYGVDLTDSGGTSVDPGGVAHTKGAYSEITAATAQDANWLVLGIGNQRNAARSFAHWLVDIAVGAAAAERIIVPDLLVQSGTTTPLVGPTTIPLPVSVPAGSRLAVRAQCSIIDATDRTFDAIIWGAG